MLFSSISFIYYFLPIVLVVYYIVPNKYRNIVLLLSSLCFYFYGEPIYTVLLLFSSVSDYFHSLVIEKHRGNKKAKIALISSICINLGLLMFFKYADFFILNIDALLNMSISPLRLALPIGISFYTFQTMSYTIDVYRGEVKAQRSLIGLATYVCLFPQLIAGPIVRYKTIAGEIDSRKHTYEDFAFGVKRFIIGLAKKVLIANAMGQLYSLATSNILMDVSLYWIAAVSFTLQIYFDFSGYSDMAIGLGRMFGFHYMENFDYPLISKSITEFWRRWHISLGTWFKDYVYIPLGGSRCINIKWIRNIIIVWMLTGFWHGASWNFVVWGLGFGVILLFEKLIFSKLLNKLPHAFGHMYVVITVVLSFVIFNNESLASTLTFYKGMFGLQEIPAISTLSIYYFKSYFVLLLIAIIGATPLPKLAMNYFYKNIKTKRIFSILQPMYLFVLLLVITAYLVDYSFNPFLYFRF